MNKQLVSLQFLLISIGLGYGQSPVNAARLYPPEANYSLESEISDLDQLPQTGRGSPDSTAGAGSRLYLPSPGGPDMLEVPMGETTRGLCFNKESFKAFRVILPIQGSGAIAKTAASESALWFYIPENEAVRAEFSIYSQDGNFDSLVYYQEINDISSREGLTRITLPQGSLQSGQPFWWDLTLTCDLEDRGADVYLIGSVQRLDLVSIQLENRPDVMAMVQRALMAEDSSLTVPDRLLLGNALLARDDAQTVQMVSDRLKAHYVGLWQRYEELNQAIDNLLLESSVDPVISDALLTDRAQLALELAQLSSFFGLWGDAVNLLAIYRAEYPGEWQMLLQMISSEEQLPE